MTSLVHLP